ncbi:hypothetical protein OAO18_06355 [Francisellaceae bacterium]|nr:hypothetical protein [Francisellaceae bacterium]
MNKSIIDLKNQVGDKYLHGICNVLSHIFSLEDVASLYYDISNPNCYINKIELYYFKGNIIGFNSWRVFEININNELIHVSRAASFLLPEFRGKGISTLFFSKQALIYKIKHIFSKTPHYFFFLACGISSFYLIHKFNDNKYVYPNVTSNTQNENHFSVAAKIANQFNYSITCVDPLKVKDQWAVPKRTSINPNNNNRSDSCGNILSFYVNNTMKNDETLIVLVVVSWRQLLSVCKKIAHAFSMKYSSMIILKIKSIKHVAQNKEFGLI